jgi:serine/threonine protein kinase
MGKQLFENNLINNDIKPHNMMLDHQGNLFMIDLDTLREPGPDAFDNHCSVTRYYAPAFRIINPITGETTRKLAINCDFNLDLYAIGITFLEILDGYLGGNEVYGYLYATFVINETSHSIFKTHRERCEFRDFKSLVYYQ